MPWRRVTPMSEKQEFISLALRPDANIARLCRYFQISRKTAYKWLTRFRREGEAGLAIAAAGPGAVPAKPRRLWRKRCWTSAGSTRSGAAAR